MKYVVVVLILLPIVFVAESFIYGGPMTISENTRSVREACMSSGAKALHCDCVAKDFESRLDLNDIIWRRLTFSQTIPDKQALYDAAELACRMKIN